MNLLDLPPEILIKIFGCLPHESLLTLSRTSQLTHEFVSQSALLQYLIQLGTSSHSPHPTDLSIAECSKLLKQKEEGWLEWKFKKKSTLVVQHPPSGIYELTCGVFLLGEASFHRNTKAAYWVDLRPKGEFEWNQLSLGLDIVDLALNVHEWDLIAVITTRFNVPGTRCIELHLLSLSSSKDSTAVPHPSAAQPVIPIVCYPNRHGNCRLSIEIVGDHLALLVLFPYTPHLVDQIYIFNWKTGKMLFKRQAERITYNALTFLSEDVLVLPHLEENVLEICSLSHSAAIASRGPATLGLIDDCQQINADYPNAAILRTQVCLGLPDLAPQMEIVMAACRGEPTPYSATHRGPNSPPFRPRSENAILKFDLTIQVEGPAHFAPPISLSFVVHRDALLAQLYEQRKHVCEAADPVDVPWGEWGPRICSWFVTDDVSSRWITTTCGQRWVTTADGESNICIRDFNMANIRRVMSMLGETTTYETDAAIITVVTSPAPLVIRVNNGVVGRIESNLPYLEIQTKETYDYTSVFMSENNLLGININRSTDYMSTVDIFSMVE